MLATERLSGWFGCRAVVATGVDVRLDMFRYLSGHAMDYFAQQHGRLAGQPGAATAGATGSVYGTWIWKVLLPCIDFVGAVIVWLRPSTRAWPWH